MITFLIIYILGIIATLWTYYHNLDSGYEVSLSELLFTIIGSLFSWVAFIILIIAIYENETVFKKK
jgi:uncharacterized membrane protein YqhA